MKIGMRMSGSTSPSAIAPVELLANLVNGRRCFIGGKRCENRVLFSICVYAADIVLHVLKLTADTFTRMTVKDFMQLQEIVGGNREYIHNFRV